MNKVERRINTHKEIKLNPKILLYFVVMRTVRVVKDACKLGRALNGFSIIYKNFTRFTKKPESVISGLMNFIGKIK